MATHIILRKYTYIRILPSDFPQAIAATINCAIATSAGAIRLAGSLSGKTVHVAGIGLLGLTTIAMCKELGADVIIASDIDENRLTLAKEFGATHTVNNKLSDPSPLFSEHPVDRFIDMSGSPQAMENGVDSLTLYGRAVFVGAVFKQPKIGISAEQVIRKMLTIQGLHNYNYADFDFAVDFILAHVKSILLPPLLSRIFHSMKQMKPFTLRCRRNLFARAYTSQKHSKQTWKPINYFEKINGRCFSPPCFVIYSFIQAVTISDGRQRECRLNWA